MCPKYLNAKFQRWRGIMLPIRIVTTVTLVAAVLGAAVASAAAQTATEPVGRPLQLLQFVQPKGKTKPPLHHKLVAKVEHKPVARLERKLAGNRHFERRIARRAIGAPPKAVAAAPQTPAAGAADALPANTQLAGTATPGVTETLTPPQATAAVTNETVVERDPNQIVANGHSVQPASPDQANAVDPAADNHEQTANEQTANEQTPNTATPAEPIAPQAAPIAMVARAAVEKPEPPSPVGSASWIGQVLAALGGAVAAGIVAWFLIWPAPIRTSA
jgi:hypothetical protein